MHKNTVAVPAVRLFPGCWFKLGGTWYRVIDVTYNSVGAPVITFHNPDMILSINQTLILHPTTLVKIRYTMD